MSLIAAGVLNNPNPFAYQTTGLSTTILLPEHLKISLSQTSHAISGLIYHILQTGLIKVISHSRVELMLCDCLLI